jgi:hypothetical protein
MSKILLLATSMIGAAALAAIAGCSQPYQREISVYQLNPARPRPLNETYPGVRELQDAPSTDPALSNRNGIELRP